MTTTGSVKESIITSEGSKFLAAKKPFLQNLAPTAQLPPNLIKKAPASELLVELQGWEERYPRLFMEHGVLLEAARSLGYILEGISHLEPGHKRR